MTTEERIAYLTDPSRFPKKNRVNPSEPDYQVSNEEYNMLVALAQEGGENGTFGKMNIDQYEELERKGLLKNTFYTIFDDKGLYRVYLGNTLIMRRREGEESISGSTYPIVFPIIFA